MTGRRFRSASRGCRRTARRLRCAPFRSSRGCSTGWKRPSRSRHSYLWPADVLQALRITNYDIGVTGSTSAALGGERREVFGAHPTLKVRTQRDSRSRSGPIGRKALNSFGGGCETRPDRKSGRTPVYR